MGSAFSDSGFVTGRLDLKSGSGGEAFRQAPVFISFIGSGRAASAKVPYGIRRGHRCS